jgi:amino acid transporter
MAALFLDVATSTSFINFGAFTAFTMVNVSVIVYYVKERRSGRMLNPLIYVVIPAIGAVITGYLLTKLDSNAIVLGLSWLAVGIVVLAFVTKGFRTLPPELTYEKDEDPSAPDPVTASAAE